MMMLASPLITHDVSMLALKYQAHEEAYTMLERPTLTTARLVLRPFTVADAPDVQRLAGERQVASTTLNIPHPYEPGMAEQWISTHQERYERGELVNFAIVRRADNTIMGCINLRINQPHAHAELGYWLGVPFWNSITPT